MPSCSECGSSIITVELRGEQDIDFSTEDHEIRDDRTTWTNPKCAECGAHKVDFDD